MGGADQEARVPNPSEVGALAFEELSDPFYDKGPNDKGIGLQLLYSIKRVMSGFFLAALVAIPIGFLIGIRYFCVYLVLSYRNLDFSLSHKLLILK